MQVIALSRLPHTNICRPLLPAVLFRKLTFVKTGRRKLGCIYSPLVQKRLGRDSVKFFFFFEQTIFFNIIVYFLESRFYASGLKRLDNFNVPSVKTANDMRY